MVGSGKYRVLLIGSGGREHALLWKILQSPSLEAIWITPGNGGTMSTRDSRVKHLPGNLADDFPALIAHAKDLNINLVIPGPEAPLIAGIRTHCQNAGIRCFGPTEEAANMEGSKAFAKAFMIRHSIPTARFQSFKDTQFDEALAFLKTMPEKVVIKASGIAAGKGVIIPETHQEAEKVLHNVMVGKEFGSAGDEVVIEEFLVGEELSFLSFCDGYTIKSLPPAQDHKQIFDGDKGPMTGGMGCYSPVAVATPALVEEIHRNALQPTIDAMRRDGIPFVGLLFTGFMVTPDGPKVLEYNVRFGDPETQTLLPLLSPEADLLKIMVACTDGYLDAIPIPVKSDYSVTVVTVAGGYPGSYPKGDEISVSKVEPPSNTRLFHAGTSLRDGKLLTNGGRVIVANGTGSSLQEALDSAYATVQTISFPGMFYRKDIGHRGLNASKSVTTHTSTTNNTTPLTYAQSGVSITAGNDLVTNIKSLVAATARPGTNASIGGFGGLFSLPLAGYTHPNTTLIGAIDGIGTKLFLAQQLSIHDTVGIDLVAMNVNDLVVQGAEPLFFLDCYTCAKLDVSIATSFVSGVAAGCREANCALIGGETAEMPGLFSKGISPQIRQQLNIKDSGAVYDGVGAAIGAVSNGTTILPAKQAMQAGDIVLGLASNGLHSNGFSLVRRILESSSTNLSDQAPWNSKQSIGEALMTPTRIYVKSILAALKKFNTSESDSETITIKGLAHITGGGLTENIPRAIPKHLSARIDASSWNLPGVFRWVRTAAGGSGIADDELARVWNCGIGMVVIVDSKRSQEIKSFFESHNETVYEIGKLENRSPAGSKADNSEGCVVVGMDKHWH